jgi:methyltransferase (TIGR00027 family)
VILAAGLDSRAYRLGWPADTIVYEIDMPAVLEYGTATLDAHGAQPTTRREVPVDLRHDWPNTLRDSGFDPNQPTAWPAEGLLPFLPGPAQEAMFAAIDGLSVPGSPIAVEVFGVEDDRRQEVEERWNELRATRERRGRDASFSPLDLWYDNEGRPRVCGVVHAPRLGHSVRGQSRRVKPAGSSRPRSRPGAGLLQHFRHR